MALDEPHQTDTVLEMAGFKVMIDALSLQHLEGAEVDYAETVLGGGFRIHNPNAAGGGCS